MESSATTHFTHYHIEEEIKNLWKEMQQIRNDPSLPLQIKVSILQRLFIVNNELHIESLRQQELYFKHFLNELKVDEMNATILTEGLLKCHLNRAIERKRLTKRSASHCFIDPGVVEDEGLTRRSSLNNPSPTFCGILEDRNAALREELKRLAFIKSTPEVEDRRRKINEKLKYIQKE